MTAAERPVLLYRATCSKCRWMSASVVALSCFSVRRLPFDTLEAQQIYARFGQPLGKLALLDRGGFRTGREIPLFAALAIVRGALGLGARLAYRGDL